MPEICGGRRGARALLVRAFARLMTYDGLLPVLDANGRLGRRDTSRRCMVPLPAALTLVLLFARR